MSEHPIIVNASMLTDPPMLSAYLMQLAEEHGLPLEVRFVMPDWSAETVGEAFGIRAKLGEMT